MRPYRGDGQRTHCPHSSADPVGHRKDEAEEGNALEQRCDEAESCRTLSTVVGMSMMMASRTSVVPLALFDEGRNLVGGHPLRLVVLQTRCKDSGYSSEMSADLRVHADTAPSREP